MRADTLASYQEVILMAQPHPKCFLYGLINILRANDGAIWECIDIDSVTFT